MSDRDRERVQDGVLRRAPSMVDPLGESLYSITVQRALASAHADHVRPRCFCTPAGVEMYIARVGPDRYVVKRMPETGMAHAPGCPSYQSSCADSVPADVANGSAGAGGMVLRSGFTIAATGRTRAGSVDERHGEFAGQGALTLRELLQYLWTEAGLTTWSPGMAGKRNWNVVSWHLRDAVKDKYARGTLLADLLFVPEPFRADRKADLAARRLAAWDRIRRSGSLMITVGEVKAVRPTRRGHKLLIKHLPDVPFLFDDDAHRRLLRRFGDEWELACSDEGGHLMAIATCRLGRAAPPTVQDAALMMTDQHWLPYRTVGYKHLLEAATAQSRRFVAQFRESDHAIQGPSLILTDTSVPTIVFAADRWTAPECVERAAAGGARIRLWGAANPASELPPPARTAASADPRPGRRTSTGRPPCGLSTAEERTSAGAPNHRDHQQPKETP